MTKGNKISKATAVKTPETGSESATSNSVPTQDQDGVMQAAITDFIRHDETVMKAIIDTVSNALVTKLLGNKSFIDTLSLKLMANGVLDGVKQSVYEANAMETARRTSPISSAEKELKKQQVELSTDHHLSRDSSISWAKYRNCNMHLQIVFLY